SPCMRSGVLLDSAAFVRPACARIEGRTLGVPLSPYSRAPGCSYRRRRRRRSGPDLPSLHGGGRPVLRDFSGNGPRRDRARPPMGDLALAHAGGDGRGRRGGVLHALQGGLRRREEPRRRDSNSGWPDEGTEMTDVRESMAAMSLRFLARLVILAGLAAAALGFAVDRIWGWDACIAFLWGAALSTV